MRGGHSTWERSWHDTMPATARYAEICTISCAPRLSRPLQDQHRQGARDATQSVSVCLMAVIRVVFRLRPTSGVRHRDIVHSVLHRHRKGIQAFLCGEPYSIYGGAIG